MIKKGSPPEIINQCYYLQNRILDMDIYFKGWKNETISTDISQSDLIQGCKKSKNNYSLD